MSKSRFIVMLMYVVVIVALVATGYFYNQVRILKQNPQAVAEQETKDLMAKVSLLIVLPVGETPTVATVSDPAALKDQAFFVNAKKGDKVLIYNIAKKAILYSPVLNKIVEVAPINPTAVPSGVDSANTTKK